MDRHALAQAAPGKVEHIFDQRAHAQRASADGADQPLGPRTADLAGQQVGAQTHGTQGRAQVVAKHRDKLLAQTPHLTVGRDDRNGDITLELIGRRRMVLRIDRMRAGVGEHHRLAVLADLVADG